MPHHYVNAGKAHWFVCPECKVCWNIGWGLFSLSEDETEETQRKTLDKMEADGFRTVEGYYPPYDKPIKVELVDSHFFTRWPCTVCGGSTGKVEILAEAQSDGIRVCETCLESGEIDARLQAHAAQLLEHANWLQSLVDRIEVPVFAEWRDRMDQAEARKSQLMSDCPF